ncbi:cell envelope integrity EipB family protein [Lutibaculum baratangense]|nr:cell envelope integrity EipB family protein [Lutibaculum baratangense]
MISSAKSAAASCLAVFLAVPAAAASSVEVELAPHLAVYDVGLERSTAASGVEDFRGRLVFRIAGSSCAGYETETRFLGEVSGETGAAVTDTRSTTSESADGRRFSFHSERYTGDELLEETEGVARRTGEGVAVELERPDGESFALPADVAFPSQHMVMILEAALEGRRIVVSQVYDGSESGHFAYDTTTTIGRKKSPMPEDQPRDLQGNAGSAMSRWTSWPVTIAYFDPTSEDPYLPAYEFTYDLFANGISRSIRLDYGDFVLSGRLASLELGDAPDCDL